jgi:hypothetical protein
MKSIRIAISVFLFTIAAFAEVNFISASGVGLGPDLADAAARGISEAESSLYDQCSSGRVTNIRITQHVVNTSGYYHVYVDAHATCESR